MSDKQPKAPPAAPDEPIAASADDDLYGDAAPPTGTGPMDVGLLSQLVKLMSANDLSAVDLRDGDRRIVLRRGPQHSAAPQAPAYAPPPQPMPSSPAAVGTAAPAAPAATPPADADAGLIPVKSPMVGTYYNAPSPDAKPFVSVGDRVTADTDVCIIEAMKVFNNIKAEAAGTVAKVLVETGKPVEFGQTLFLLKP